MRTNTAVMLRLIAIVVAAAGCSSDTSANGEPSAMGGSTSPPPANAGGAGSSTAGSSSPQAGEGGSGGSVDPSSGSAGVAGDASGSAGQAGSAGNDQTPAAGGGQGGVSTTVDAGANNGGGREAGAPEAGAPPPRSGCTGLLLCDDFESYAASSPPSGQWKVSSSGSGTVVVDAQHARSGTKAAHFHGTVNRDAAYMIAQGAPVFPVQGNTLYVRFMMYIQRYSIGNPMHNRIAWVGSSAALRNADGTGYAMETYNGIGIERIASGHFRTTGQRLTDSTNLGKWLCWEFEIDNKGGPIPTGTGTVMPHLWREGTELKLAISGQATGWNVVPWDLLQFSLFSYQSDTAATDYWIDDVAMNNQRIGCPMP